MANNHLCYLFILKDLNSLIIAMNILIGFICCRVKLANASHVMILILIKQIKQAAIVIVNVILVFTFTIY